MRAQVVGVALAAGVVLAGCKTMDSGNISGIMDTGSTAMKALTLSDSDVVNMSNESCEAMDAEKPAANAPLSMPNTRWMCSTRKSWACRCMIC